MGEGLNQRPGKGSGVDFVDHGFSQGLQHLPLVVIKVSIDLVDGAVLHHPQLALGLCDQPSIVAYYDHRWKTDKEKDGMSGCQREKVRLTGC